MDMKVLKLPEVPLHWRARAPQLERDSWIAEGTAADLESRVSMAEVEKDYRARNPVDSNSPLDQVFARMLQALAQSRSRSTSLLELAMSFSS